MPRPRAQTFVEDLHVNKGETVKLFVAYRPEQGMPESVPQPITNIDLLGGRPTNVVCDNAGFEVDLCFNGPVQRCRFRWQDIIAVSVGDQPQPLLLVFPAQAMQMEDGTLAVIIQRPPEAEEEMPEEEPPKPSRAHLSVVK
jgi:hypothetical protein